MSACKVPPIGARVNVLEEGKIIDQGMVLATGKGGQPPKPEVVVDSLWLQPGVKQELVLVNPETNEWLVIFKDPHNNRRCISERGQLYVLEVAGV